MWVPKFSESVGTAIVEATGRIVGEALQKTLSSNEHNEFKTRVPEYVEAAMGALVKRASEFELHHTDKD